MDSHPVRRWPLNWKSKRDNQWKVFAPFAAWQRRNPFSLRRCGSWLLHPWSWSVLWGEMMNCYWALKRQRYDIWYDIGRENGSQVCIIDHRHFVARILQYARCITDTSSLRHVYTQKNIFERGYCTFSKPYFFGIYVTFQVHGFFCVFGSLWRFPGGENCRTTMPQPILHGSHVAALACGCFFISKVS